ncbi:LCP family protein [Sporolactobacillus sp. Y61]|jgi:LCP family protein required for cell wall assembly|uniref:LCP family protein n=1 Tax=Sporolactobacillus sp. Y61 TaxID=3160863 RepID=A0AAU8IBP0_9BACL
MTVSRHINRQNNKRRRRRKTLLIILAVFVVLAGCAATYGVYLTKKLQNVTDHAQNQLTRGDKSDLRTEQVDPVKDNFSILFLGIDKRENEPARSDAMVLATFNHGSNKVKMVSIPRDSKVQIVDPTGTRDYGISKITHAHAYGDANDNQGVDYTVATVEKLFDIPVDYYVQVDFKAFVKIINALGGVKMDVPVRLVTQNSKDKTGNDAIVLEPGMQTLNGEQALSVVRNRKSPGSGGDFGRGLRQMEMIEAIVKKSTQLSSVTKYGNMIDSLNGHFQTNLTFGQLLSLRKYAGSLSSIDSMQLKGTDDSSTGVYYYTLDQSYLQEVSSELQNQLGVTPTATDGAGSDADPSDDPTGQSRAASPKATH